MYARRLRERFTELARIDKPYDQRLRDISVRLGNLAGQTVRPVLIVEAGEGSGQDWAAWSRPMIDARREIAFTGFQCILESTSGWSEFRRRRRRSWNSDEFALLVHVLGFDETGSEQRYAGAQFRATSSVDSGESFSFSPMVFSFPPSDVRHLEVRMVGLEIDGAGATDYLAQYAFNSWVGTTFMPGGGTRYSFNSAYDGPRSNNEHNRLAADYWWVDSDRMLVGGVEPPGLWVPPARAPASVEDYLREIGISRSIARNSFEDMTMESRRYRNGSQYSDYVINVSYR